MSVLLATVVVVVFGATIHRLHLAERAREVARRARACLDVLRDPVLGDDEKERILQKQAVRLFALLGVLTGGSVLALALPLGGVWVLDAVGMASFGAVLDVLERPDYLAGVTVAGVVGYLVLRWRSRA